MRVIGFSTGSLSLGDFNKALYWLHDTDIKAVELSALRKHELEPLVQSLDKIDVSQFEFVSVHAPSKYEYHEECEIVRLLGYFVKRGWPIVVHPDSVFSWDLWRKFGQLLFIENMDNRKPLARDAAEIEEIFNKVPEAKLCFDIGHARQHDNSMRKALIILDRYKSRLGQIHISEVGSNSRHLKISYQAKLDFQKLATNIPIHIPIILETPVQREEMLHELRVAESSLSPIQRGLINKVRHNSLSNFRISTGNRFNQLAKFLYTLKVRC